MTHVGRGVRFEARVHHHSAASLRHVLDTRRHSRATVSLLLRRLESYTTSYATRSYGARASSIPLSRPLERDVTLLLPLNHFKNLLRSRIDAINVSENVDETLDDIYIVLHRNSSTVYLARIEAHAIDIASWTGSGSLSLKLLLQLKILHGSRDCL